MCKSLADRYMYVCMYSVQNAPYRYIDETCLGLTAETQNRIDCKKHLFDNKYHSVIFYIKLFLFKI